MHLVCTLLRCASQRPASPQVHAPPETVGSPQPYVHFPVNVLFLANEWVSLCLAILGVRPEPPVTGSAGPSGPRMLKKSQEGLPGPVGPECPKSAEKVWKVPKKSLFGTFSRLFGLFRHFLGTPGLQARDHLFETLLAFWTRLPVTGRYNRKYWGCAKEKECVVRRNGHPKGCFWRVRFLSAPLGLSGV